MVAVGLLNRAIIAVFEHVRSREITIDTCTVIKNAPREKKGENAAWSVLVQYAVTFVHVIYQSLRLFVTPPYPIETCTRACLM